jgi:hypothetical protein
MDVHSDVQLTSVGVSSPNPGRAQIIVGAVASEMSCLDVRWTSKFRPLSLQSRRNVLHVVARACACASQHRAACARPAQAALIRSELTPRSTGGSKQLMRSWEEPSVITTLIPSQARSACRSKIRCVTTDPVPQLLPTGPRRCEPFVCLAMQQARTADCRIGSFCLPAETRCLCQQISLSKTSTYRAFTVLDNRAHTTSNLTHPRRCGLVCPIAPKRGVRTSVTTISATELQMVYRGT